ncbi:uncharacterized protein LOC103714615 [Phoenix dactylifera]|uniref:Uncharacterized protein LOC103714615 n=1 Tax=Phoenix dactylifera TaxID=42345 RepID=A0A8B7CJB3_PHODC|nr:uncharacterized protein LOC103714615 [Phoenix dactylifera]
MGCCFSKTEAPSCGKPPEPEAPQEETVKEVLSETPKPRARTREEGIEKEELGFDKVLKGGPCVSSINGGYDERSEENSEVCSISEGFSASTMATDSRVGEEGDAEEVEGEPRRASEERSPAKFQRKLSRNRESGASCGSGRISQSPVKRRAGAVGRTYSARETGQGNAARSRVPAGDAFRRDPGERSGRRSVSPAAKRAADLRSATTGGQCRVVPASRGNGRSSPLRIPPPPDEDERRAEEASCGDGGEGKESLENPLVSLECFIFL